MLVVCRWNHPLLSRARNLFPLSIPSTRLHGRCWKDNSLHDALWRRSASLYYSTVTPAPPASQTIEVACRSNGSITLNIFHPFTGSSFDPTILYLPAGPVIEQVNTQAIDDAIIAALSASSNATIVRVNYRAGPRSPYPIPIHDVLAGYDWTLSRIAEDDALSRQPQLRKLGVVGQLLGGSLASMLALTECRLGQSRIVAAAFNNPIVDWVEPDREELAKSLSDKEKTSIEGDAEADTQNIMSKGKNRRKQKKNISSWREFSESSVFPARMMLRARNSLFQSEDDFFDRFASPVHFFRTPGVDVPQDLQSLPYDPDEGPPIPKLLRKSRRAYPPYGSNIVLPHVRLSCGEQSLLLTQNEEFIEKLSSSEVTWHLKAQGLRLEQYNHLDEEHKNEVKFIYEEAGKKFQTSRLPGVGLWGLGRVSDWRYDVESAGSWLRQILLKA